MKKLISVGVVLAVLVIGTVAPSDAGRGGRGGGFRGHGGFHHFHHFHGRSVVVFGGGFFAPFWWPPYPYVPYPGYGYAPTVTDQQVVYVQQAAAAGALEPGYWYYCDAAKGYYPAVQECPAGWLKIAPSPSPSPTPVPSAPTPPRSQ